MGYAARITTARKTDNMSPISDICKTRAKQTGMARVALVTTRRSGLAAQPVSEHGCMIDA